MPTRNTHYYDRDARPSSAKDENIPTRGLITYDDTCFVVLNEVSDAGEMVWNNLDEIGNATGHIRSSRHVNIGEVELSKTDKELDFGKQYKCRDASKSTMSERYTNPKEASSRKRRYNQCEKANDKSEDTRNVTINISGPKRKQKDSPDRSSETNRDRSKLHKSYNWKQTSDIHSYPPFYERQVKSDNHTQCTFTQSPDGNTIHRDGHVLYNNELSTETQTELTKSSTDMDWHSSPDSNRSILPYSDFTKRSPLACFQYSDQSTFQNNGSFHRNILYNDRGSIQVEHQHEHYNQERDIPHGNFENANFQGVVYSKEIHVNPKFIFPRQIVQDEQNRNVQVNEYFNTNGVPYAEYIPQFNTHDNVTNLHTNSTVANIDVQINAIVSNDIIKSSHSQKNMATNVHRTLVQMRKTNLTPPDGTQSEINDEICHSKENKTHDSNVQPHDNEKHEVELSVLPEYIPLDLDSKLLDTGHATPHNIQTTDTVVEQVVSSCVDIVVANTTTENTKEGTVIESNSNTNSNTHQTMIGYPNTGGKYSDSVSPDGCPLPSWSPLKYERKYINKDDEDLDGTSNQSFGEQNELTISNGKSPTETMLQDVDGELTEISIGQINSNPPMFSMIMQRNDKVVADASVEMQDFANADQYEMQTKKNMQTCIAITETEKLKSDSKQSEKGHEISSTTQLCIADQTTMEEDCDTETSEEVSDRVDIMSNKTIPSAMNTAVAFEMADEGGCYHLRRLNCKWQLEFACGIWKDIEYTESTMLDAIHAKFTARKKSRSETKQQGTC